MWDRIKQLWQKDTAKQTLTLSEAEQFALLDQANQALQQSQYETALQLAGQLSHSDVEAIFYDALRILGLVNFRRQQYAQAWPLFERLATRTGTVGDWFNVVTSATLAGEIQRGRAAFEHAMKAYEQSPDSPGLSAASMHYFYACALRERGEDVRAFEHIQILRALYEKLPQTDGRLLELRGFPRLDAVLDVMADVLAHSGDLPEAEQWLLDFDSALKGDTHEEVLRAIERMHMVASQASAEPGRQPPPPPPSAAATPAAAVKPRDNDPRLD